jgi:hypothetical protein
MYRHPDSIELMDIESGNLVGLCLTLEDALAVVGEAYATYGLPGIADLGLVRVESDGSQTSIVVGSGLLQQALASSLALHDSAARIPSGHERQRPTSTG